MSTAAAESFSVREAAEQLGLPAYRVQRLIRLGVIRAIRVPRCRPRIPAGEVERVRSQYVEPATAG